MVAICERYSKAWSFSFSPAKSKLLQFGKHSIGRNVILRNMDITVPLSDLQAFNVRSIVFNDVSNTIPTCLALDTWVIGSLYKISLLPQGLIWM
jgi:hypothetical protein